MKSSQQRYTGTDYNSTVALVIVALVFSPALLVLSSPFGNASVYASAAFSAMCLVLAWANWKKRSALTIPSIVD